MKKKGIKVVCETEISEVVLTRGQTLTVWMQKGDEGETRREQVELRVNFDGTPEIFVDGIKTKKFDKWKGIYDDY